MVLRKCGSKLHTCCQKKSLRFTNTRPAVFNGSLQLISTYCRQTGRHFRNDWQLLSNSATRKCTACLRPWEKVRITKELGERKW